MKQTILLFNLLLFSVVSFAQDKLVHFAHGLGGEEASWDALATEMDACPNVTTTNFEMTSTEGIEIYQIQFDSSLVTVNSGINAIAIGHSFGGGVLRQMDQEGTELFGGYFTVGTPHHGAPLANSYLDGDLEAWFSIGGTHASNLISTLISLRPFIKILFQDKIDALQYSLAEGGIFETLEERLPFVGEEGGTINQLMTGGSFENLAPASLPAIGIKCAIPKKENEFWRLMSYFESEAIYGAVCPLSVQNKAIAIELSLIAGKDILNLWGTMSFANIFSNFLVGQKIRKAASETRSLLTWWQNIESNWNQLIGAGSQIIGYENQAENVWVCDCIDEDGIPVVCDGSEGQQTNNAPLAVFCENDLDCYQVEMSLQPIFDEDELNDGVVPKERQDLPGALKNEYVEGPTHFEEPESGGVRNVIKNNIDPDIAPHPVFKIKNCLQ